MEQAIVTTQRSEPAAAVARVEADACHFTGSGHDASQDHAMAGCLEDGRWFALVADGCSSSPGSDVGARLVTLSARQWLRLGARDVDTGRVARRAAEAARVLGAPPTCLDATLLSATTDGHRVRVRVAGDGVVAALGRDGGIETWTIDCDGAPSYPSLALDEGRWRAWTQRFGRRTVTRHRDGQLVSSWTTRVGAPARDAPPAGQSFTLQWDLDVREHRAVLLLSDGALSFRRRHPDADESVLGLHDVVTELLAFRSTAGCFLKRRAKRFLRRAHEERGWEHADDLGLAALHFDDQNRHFDDQNRHFDDQNRHFDDQNRHVEEAPS